LAIRYSALAYDLLLLLLTSLILEVMTPRKQGDIKSSGAWDLLPKGEGCPRESHVTQTSTLPFSSPPTSHRRRFGSRKTILPSLLTISLAESGQHLQPQPISHTEHHPIHLCKSHRTDPAASHVGETRQIQLSTEKRSHWLTIEKGPPYSPPLLFVPPHGSTSLKLETGTKQKSKGIKTASI
jgi:hypothetical protein